MRLSFQLLIGLPVWYFEFGIQLLKSKSRFTLKDSLVSRVPPSFEEESVQSLISEERKKLPAGVYLDMGSPLPVQYGVDRLQLMLQSPFGVFAYWELTAKLIKEALAPFPEKDRTQFQIVLQWFEVGGAMIEWFDIGTTSQWWFVTVPEKQYQARLCLYSQDYGFVPLLSSNVVTTPRFSLGPAPVDVQESTHTLPLLRELVRMTGLGKGEEQSRPPLTKELEAESPRARVSPEETEKLPGEELPAQEMEAPAPDSSAETRWPSSPSGKY